MPSTLKVARIREIAKGDIVINLGEVLEIDIHSNYINLIISRLNQKQVIKFEKNALLVTT